MTSEHDMAMSGLSDVSSVLSDVPSLAYDGDFSDDEPCSPGSLDDFPTTPAFTDEISLPQSGFKRKAFSQSQYYSDDSDLKSEDVVGDKIRQLSISHRAKRRRVVVKNAPLAPIEILPNEILQNIAVDLSSDTDLHNLTLASPTIAQRVIPENSEIWRYKFLALYDHPRIRAAYDFCVAYKLRRYVLRTFDSPIHGFNLQHVIQLEVVRDMILETYSSRQPYLPAPRVSRNLRAFASPTLSHWTQILLSCPFPAFKIEKYGVPSKLFETIQLTLSHLLLSPQSALAHFIETSRSNYDMAKIYNFNKSFTTLYVRRTIEEDSVPVLRRSRLFPKLNSPSPKPPSVVFELDTNTLLHIRNFWHRHLIDDSEPSGEHTYAAMARGLLKLGHTPQEWSRPLRDDIPVNRVWHGHYSALYPWPIFERQLEERQSAADDWHNVDPMKLEFVTTDDYAEGFWPPAMSSFSAFRNTVSEPAEEDYRRLFENDGHGPKTKSKKYLPTESKIPKGLVYIRGIAPFLDLPTARTDNINPGNHVASVSSPVSSMQPVNKAQRYHPFVALRIRGVVHDIPASATTSVDDLPGGQRRGNHSIPGWKRIVMVMYKPNVRYLLQVLEFAAEDFGGTFGTQITNTLNLASVSVLPDGQVAGPNVVTNTIGATTSTLPNTVSNTATTLPPSLATNPSGQTVPQAIILPTLPNPQQPQPLPLTPTTPVNPLALHTQLTQILHSRLEAYTSALPPASTTRPFSPEHIISLENAFSPPHVLDWADGTIDYAYAYEGVIIPGGKIMMGRWWRCHGSLGAGGGMEVNSLGEGVEYADDDDDDDEGEEPDDATRNDGAGDPGGELDGLSATAGVEGGIESTTPLPQRRTKALERGPFVFWS